MALRFDAAFSEQMVLGRGVPPPFVMCSGDMACWVLPEPFETGRRAGVQRDMLLLQATLPNNSNEMPLYLEGDALPLPTDHRMILRGVVWRGGVAHFSHEQLLDIFT